MAKSEPENWRLSDAPEGAKHRVQSVTANGSAGPHTGNPAPETEPVPTVEIRYPKGIEDDARAYKSREEGRARWRLLLEALAVVAIVAYGALAYRQWRIVLDATDNSTKALQVTERSYAAVLRDTEQAYAGSLQASGKAQVAVVQATERAYVTFGSKTGELGEFFGNTMSVQNRIIALHFYNSGHSTARNLSVHVVTDGSGLISRRHRFKGPQGDIVSTEVSPERDLAAGAEHSEYFASPWSQTELANNPTDTFTLTGQLEYCDVFGAYHCQEFSTNYMPNLRQFVPNSVQSCAVEPVTSDNPGKGYVEIAPCEQPDELDAQTAIPRIASGARTSGSKVK